MTVSSGDGAEYSDCALRMACLAGRRGNFPEAKKWIERALEVKTNHSDAHSLMGESVRNSLLAISRSNLVIESCLTVAQR